MVLQLTVKDGLAFGRWIWDVVTSQIGLKVIMAVTGLILAVFVLGHMLGNLQFFVGAEALNHYAELLQSKPAMVWAVRGIMGLTVLVHIAVGIRLKLANMAARPVKYAYETTVKATLASRTMVISGLTVGAFVVYHLAHLTVKAFGTATHGLVDKAGRPDVYAMAVRDFSNPWLAVPYVVAMVLLGFHLSHAMSSVFQTLGLNHRRFEVVIGWVGPVFAIIVVGGFIMIPIAGLFGWLSVPAGGK